RTAILRGVVRGIYLEFLHRFFGGGVLQAGAAALVGKVRVGVVRAIYGVVVQQLGLPAKAQEAKAGGIGDDAGSQQREAGPTAAIDGQVVDLPLIHDRRDIGRRGIHQRIFSRDGDSLSRATDGKVRGKAGKIADRDNGVLRLEWREAGGGDGDVIT